MSIEILNRKQTSRIDPDAKRNSYPWRMLDVGESFFVPFESLTCRERRPWPSKNLTDDGYTVRTRVVRRKGQEGVLCIRTA